MGELPFAPAGVQLTLPTFSFEDTLWLRDTLEALGLISAFDPALADLSRIHPTAPLVVDDVMQKAFVRVDEEGTEAAAVSGVDVSVTTSSTIPDAIPFAVDHPFWVAIVDQVTGAILFQGRIVDPR